MVRLASRLGFSTDDFVNKILFDDSSIHELTKELTDENEIREPVKEVYISPEKKKTNVSFFPKNFFKQTTDIVQDEKQTITELDLHQEKQVINFYKSQMN